MLDYTALSAPAKSHTANHHIPREASPQGMAMPDLPQRHYTRPPHYAVAIIDGHGRMATSSSVRVLGWEPGSPIAFTVNSDRVITASRYTDQQPPQSTTPSRKVTPQRHLNLPLVIRRRAGIASGDHLLLAADADGNLLHIYPPNILALALHLCANHQDQQP